TTPVLAPEAKPAGGVQLTGTVGAMIGTAGAIQREAAPAPQKATTASPIAAAESPEGWLKRLWSNLTSPRLQPGQEPFSAVIGILLTALAIALGSNF
ncbi:MAG TPA: hypothetical protein VES39_06075, partial [Rhodospirillales bacterium]|nr:hypothetical protein [Rhodospirillales bacterium]